MNLVGKIFVVLIFVMSLVFMSFAMAVYATHRNWRDMVVNEQAAPDKPLGLSLQLKNEQNRNKELNDEKDKLKSQYDTEKAAKTQALTKLANELKNVKDELTSLKEQENKLEEAKRESVATMKTTQEAAAKFQQELEALRKEVLEGQRTTAQANRGPRQGSGEARRSASQVQSRQEQRLFQRTARG